MDNMIRTVEMPHLPKGRVRHIIIGEKYRNLLEKTGLSGNLFTCVLKVIGVGYLVEFSSGICAEAGVSSVANKILLAGKVLILIMCMPVLQSLIDVVLKLVP